MTRQHHLHAFIDTNIPMYAGGEDHPLRQPCIEVLHLVSKHPDSFIADVEVLQELLHVYKSRRQWPAGRVVFDAFAILIGGGMASILLTDVRDAATLAEAHLRLSARDLIHLAVMRRLGVSRIITADRGFDGIPDIERLDPARIDDWRDDVVSSH